jgi:dipeptidyl aminopeptidase/acylaminoacyl peptidase
MSKMAGKASYILVAAVTLAVFVLSNASADSFQKHDSRPVVVADSIGMTSIADPASEFLGSPPATFSPDGKRFVVVLRHGDIKNNSVKYAMYLFETAEVFQVPHPKKIVELSSLSNNPGIRNVHWLSDSKTLLFLGERPGQHQQIFSYNIKSESLEQITTHATDIVSFDATQDLSTIIFIAQPPIKQFFGGQTLKGGLVVSSQLLYDLIVGHSSDNSNFYFYSDCVFVKHKGAKEREIALPNDLPLADAEVSISPDGMNGVLQTEVKDPPDSWKAFKEAMEPGEHPYRYMLLNTRAGTVRPVIDAPISHWSAYSRVAWSADSKSVFIGETEVPSNVRGNFQVQPANNSFVVEVSIDTGMIEIIAAGDLAVVSWDAERQTLLVRAPLRGPMSQDVLLRYHKSGGQWKRVLEEATGPEFRSEIEVTEEQNMNAPPQLLAVNQKTGKRSLLIDLNPQFHMLKFGVVEAIEWTGSDGHAAKGGLYLPSGYVPGRRYPLVIQTHGWNPAKFWIDGPSTAAFAAQTLAGKDFVVAQTADDYSGDVHEGPGQMAAYEGLVDELDRRGVIDRSRVGLLGWSRTGYSVRYALTFSKYRFAAAVIADGMDGSYMQHLIEVNQLQPPKQVDLYEKMHGAQPLGDGLELWKENATGFNLDRVQTPVQLQLYGPYSILIQWEWFAGLVHLGKPVEMVWLRDALHSPVKPQERLTAQQGAVDWFSFWLKGEEDSDPAKIEQYQRWRKLRSLQESNNQASIPQ